jgi:hypothetical protein
VINALHCSVCGTGVENDEGRLNFTGAFYANVCGACRRDFERSNHESIEQSIQRRGCHPRDVLPGWRARRPLA